MASILYFGDSHPASTSFHRADALRRLGHYVTIQDTDKKAREQAFSAYLWPFHYRTGFRFMQQRMCRWVKGIVGTTEKPDLIWINSGELLGPRCLKMLKKIGSPIVLYNNDDPTGKRDGAKFDSLLRSLPYYDLCVVMREMNVAEFRARGARRVMRVYMSYDEQAHRPFERPDDIPAGFRSNVAFIGSWMRNEKRDEFLLKLINRGIPLSIWGGRWQKSPHWKALQHAFRGEALGGRSYVAAIQGAQVCLGLLSKGNRDLHTQRSFEVPYAGGLLCAERTTEHRQLYREGEEAFFWSDADECAEICRKLLDDERLREQVRIAGMKKVRSQLSGNEQVCQKILDEINIR